MNIKVLYIKIIEEYEHHASTTPRIFVELTTNLDDSTDVYTSSRTCTCDSHSYTSPNLEESWGFYE